MSIAKDLKLIVAIVAKERTKKVLDALEEEGIKKALFCLAE